MLYMKCNIENGYESKYTVYTIHADKFMQVWLQDHPLQCSNTITCCIYRMLVDMVLYLANCLYTCLLIDLCC